MKRIAYIAVTTALTLGAFFVGKTCFPKTEIRTETVEIVPDGYVDTGSEEFLNNYVDMRQVVDFTASVCLRTLLLSCTFRFFLLILT